MSHQMLQKDQAHIIWTGQNLLDEINTVSSGIINSSSFYEAYYDNGTPTLQQWFIDGYGWGTYSIPFAATAVVIQELVNMAI